MQASSGSIAFEHADTVFATVINHGTSEPSAGLDVYLEAATAADRNHPYGALSVSAPPLATVYVRQQAHRRVQKGEDDAQAPQPETEAEAQQLAEDVLGRDRNCVVIAGPGGGKSSLLRTHLAASAARWREGRTSATVPVLLPAAALSQRPLPETIAEVATSTLSHFGLRHSLSAELFRAAPRPGTHWQVLVDGLDEIADRQGRLEVLSTLAAHAAEPGTPYRFVVATRPLPDGELDVLGDEVPRYVLQPFTADDLRHFAKGWFEAGRLPAPEDAAENFMAAMERTRLAALARTPLMATMLCQLYADAPERPLPAGRSGVYQRFLGLLHDRQHAQGTSGIHNQTRAALERYGPEALAAAQNTVAHLPDLIAYLAAERYGGSNEPSIDVLARHPNAECPSGVLPEVWNGFLGEALRSSGLLHATATGEFAFLHQTLMEYLAARHATRDAEVSASTYRGHFGRRIGLKRWARAKWDPHEDSYLGFLLDAWSNEATGAARMQVLYEVAVRGGNAWCRFLVRQATLGTLVPADITTAAAAHLATMAGDSGIDYGERIWSAQLLDDLGDPRGREALNTVCYDTSCAWGERVHTAQLLEELGDSRGRDALNTLATDPALDFGGRLYVAKRLVELGDSRGRDALHLLATDPAIGPGKRRHVGDALGRLGSSRGREGLDAIAADPARILGLRIAVAEELGKLGDPRGRELLNTFATDPTIGFGERGYAAKSMAKLGDFRGREILNAIAADPEFDISERREAAKVLAELGDPRGREILNFMVHCPDHDISERVVTARFLDELDDSRGREALDDLANDSDSDVDDRIVAAIALERMGDSRGREVLNALARDPDTDFGARIGAAELLEDLGYPQEHLDALNAIAADPASGFGERVTVGKALYELGDPRGRAVLEALTDSADYGESVIAALTLSKLDRTTRPWSLKRPG
ncbi:hypothetical protein ACFOSC_17455 [Streptantibioticus rubrisoli]|uniref:NACHT domain-containing protein n=1 Tax=Streptantibioticus rubrisoli TaxID=1387313 RepID=A0ABT1PHL2_9ACTN|nr:hypothetical protein [Streptantibioticus rubrisoli]MCQ4044854.1 hypothetical protein [Streptantibioticus rubrisoli]